MTVREEHVNDLKRRLKEVEASAVPAFDPSGLEARKREELEFHDRDRRVDEGVLDVADEPVAANKKFYSTTRRSVDYVDDWLRRAVPEKVFLDYGCGNGDMAIKTARLGATLAIGIDISGVSVENARRAAKAAGVDDRCVFLQADCENTGLPDGAIDVVLCSGMLHHVDLPRAFPELARIMKRGGRALGVEALGYNPLIQLYRRMTPRLRTKWESEHILSMSDVRLARRFFSVRDVRHWHLFSIGAAVLRRGSRLQSTLLAVADALDSIVLRIPGVRLMSWQFTFEMVKRE